MKMRKPVPMKPNKVIIPKSVYDRKVLPKPEINRCPNCGMVLSHFRGIMNLPDFQYCSKCNDVAYDNDGSILFKLELLVGGK